jgi:hypothetical protein
VLRIVEIRSRLVTCSSVLLKAAIYNINTIHSHQPVAVTDLFEIIQRECCLSLRRPWSPKTPNFFFAMFLHDRIGYIN